MIEKASNMPAVEQLCVVAIDGPSASGKSTVSRRVAEVLGFVYVDSGALYRGVTWKCIREGVDVQDDASVIGLIQRTAWTFAVENHLLTFRIDDEDPGRQLRSEPVRERVSDIAAIPEVRSFLVERLRETTAFGHIVMEGRDIGSVVFPDTPLKFYLDADPEERARRRHKELLEMEGAGDVDEVLNSLKRRDKKDSTRKTDPLQIPLGATVINSTSMRVEEVVNVIVNNVRAVGVPV